VEKLGHGEQLLWLFKLSSSTELHISPQGEEPDRETMP
jgi:hypothetical protein